MASLADRLRQRKVVQWALAYLAGGWVFLQLLDILRETWDLPLALVRMITVLVALGFFAVLIVAWYHGEKGQQRASGPELLMLAALLVIAGVAVRSVGGPGADVGPPDSAEDGAGGETADIQPTPGVGSPGEAAGRTVAVLPFDNFSPDEDDAYFASGMTEEITSQLSRIGDLAVLSRVAVERALESDLGLEDIGRQLGAGSVLEGSVRMAGRQVRITAQLIDVDTNEHLWSQDFDRDLDDIFKIQTEVALAIGAALQARLTAGEVSRVEAPLTDNIAAYQLYLRQTSLYGNVPAQNREGIRLLREALDLDPAFATARARLAWRYVWETRLYGRRAYADTAVALAREALEDDPDLPVAHYALASGYLGQERYAQALESYDRAMGHAGGLNDGSYHHALVGDLARATELGFRAVQLDPNGPNTRWHASVPLYFAGDVERAEAWLALARAEGMEFQRLDMAWSQLALLQGDLVLAVDRAAAVLERWEGIREAEAEAAKVMLVAGAWQRGWDILERRGLSVPDAWSSDLLVPRTARTEYAFGLAESGRTEEADQLFDIAVAASEDAIANGSDCPCRPVELAAIHAYRGNSGEALTALERAFELGFASHWVLRVDPMFASLGDDPGFRDLLARMENDRAAQREQVERAGAAAGYDAMIAAGPVLGD